jgi:hypothetical protein
MSTPPRSRTPYRAGLALVALVSLLIVWTTIVRDDGAGGGAFMVILAAGVGAYATRWQPAGMARSLLGVACMQVVLGALVATAPVTATQPDGVVKTLLFSGVFTALWLLAAGCFRAAAKATPEA